MAREDTELGRLARHFALPERALAILSSWSVSSTGAAGGVTKAGYAGLIAACERSADPDAVLLSLDRIVEAHPGVLDQLADDPAWATTVVAVLGASDALAQHLVRYPHLDDLRHPSLAHLDELQRASTPDELRIAYRRALLGITALDVTAADPYAVFPQISAALADLADAVVENALRLVRAQLGVDVPLAAVAMGKCGARELNYASDVDVIWITDTNEHLREATAIAGEVVKLCSAQTAHGSIWPLDANLRPEGKAGPLVRTLDAMASYYTAWAKPWEFQALLKARAMAGGQLAQDFVDLVTPLVWQVGDSPDFVGDSQAMRRRVVSLLAPKDADREIKLGAGGLRDVEFTVQLLQLIHGRADERLRVRGTLDALAQLREHGYIGRADADDLERHYRFQRVLEHRIQLLHLRRTHRVPESPGMLHRLDRELGLDVAASWRESRSAVQRLHQRLFYSPLLEAVARVPSSALRLTPEQAETRLTALGFADAHQALVHIGALTTGLSRKAEIQRQLMPVMLGWLADAPAPDAGLLAFRQLSEALGESPWYVRALRDEGAMAQHFATILASSRYIVEQLQRDPAAVQLLLEPRDTVEPERLTALMTQAAQRQETPQRAVMAIREVRRRELLRVAMAEVLGATPIDVVGQAISDITTATIQAALHALGGGVSVVALGRWGGQEMSYSSDADLLFVADDPKAAAPIVAELRRLLSAPGTDAGLTLDADLRPEGKNGPLVRTPESYLAYYRQWASPWEAQALLRARAFGPSFLDDLDSFRYPAALDDAALAEMRRLKVRMETERIPRGVDPKLHLKLGPGGLVDVEWVAQLLQRRHASTHPELRSTRTVLVLEQAAALGLLASDDASTLAAAWTLASRVRNAIVLSHGRAADALPTNARDLARVAALLGYGRGESSLFLNDYLSTMRRSRAVAERLLWEAA